MKPRYVVLVLIAILLCGCARQRMIARGEEYHQAGHYEMAVEEYRNALAEKPDDLDTEKKLREVESKLSGWLDQVMAAAVTAEQRAKPATAMVFYGKVASLRDDEEAGHRYQVLYQDLTDRYRYKVSLNYDRDTFGAHLGQVNEDLEIVPNTNLQHANQFHYSFRLSQPSFGVMESTRQAAGRYVSGTRWINNPEYGELEYVVANKRYRVRDFERSARRFMQQSHSAANDYFRKRNDLDAKIARRGGNTNSPNHQLEGEISRLRNEVSNAEYAYSRAQQRERDSRWRLDQERSELSRLMNELLFMPRMIEENIYSDHVYPVTQTTQFAEASLTVTANGISEEIPVDLNIMDESHAEQPLLDLAPNVYIPTSQPDLVQGLNQEAQHQAELFLEGKFAQYRDGLMAQVRNADSEDKFEALVRYGLSSPKGVDDHLAGAMQTQMKFDLGLEGEYAINRLLRLYQN